MDRLASVGKLDGVIHGEDGHLDRPSLIFLRKTDTGRFYYVCAVPL